MAKKAETFLLSFKFLATAGGLWFAWKSYKKKEAMAAAQMLAYQQGAPVTATTPLSISTGQRLPGQNKPITMMAPGDSVIQSIQPTRPLDSLKASAKTYLQSDTVQDKAKSYLESLKSKFV